MQASAVFVTPHGRGIGPLTLEQPQSTATAACIFEGPAPLMLPGLTLICFYLSFYPILKGAGYMLFCLSCPVYGIRLWEPWRV